MTNDRLNEIREQYRTVAHTPAVHELLAEVDRLGAQYQKRCRTVQSLLESQQR